MAVDLRFDAFGQGDPVLILHGLFGSRQNWTSVARELARDHRVVVADLRNHGESPWAEPHDYPAMADDLGHLIETVIGRPAAVIGHSMGGKAAMFLAITRPELVERLIVVDIPPAASAGASRGILASLAGVRLEGCSRRADVDAALAAAIPDPRVRRFLLKNVTNGPDGLAWSLNLTGLERAAEAIFGFPEVPAAAYHKPTLFIVGGRSDYVRPEHHAAMARLFPALQIETIEHAGHWVQADAPQAFLELARRFLDK